MTHTAQKHWRLGIGVLIGLVLLGAAGSPQGLWAEEDAIFFQQTGHRLSNEQGFLSFWREHNGEQMLGAAVTDVLEEGGLTVQYFERGRLEQHAELDGAPIMLGRVGAEYAAALWHSFEPAAPRALAADEQTFAATGHTLSPPFSGFWAANGGVAMLGYPLSEPLWEYVGSEMLLVQYFERGRLEQHPLAAGTSGEITISTLGRDLALLRGLPTAAAAPPAPEAAAIAAPEPAVAAPAAAAPKAAPAAKPAPAKPARSVPVRQATGAKHITVDLSAQWLYAYEGDTMVFDAPVSTGRDGFNTPPGNFAVYAKLRSQTMSGTIGGEYYNVPDVPHVMYINGGVALHGTYWHNQFGKRRMSHGCINLPQKAAAWLYGWAPQGTTVRVKQ